MVNCTEQEHMWSIESLSFSVIHIDSIIHLSNNI